MMQIEQVITDDLKELGYPVYQDGAYSTEDIADADTIIAFWVMDSESLSHYDNKPMSVYWHVQLAIYAVDSDELDKAREQVVSTLALKGWQRDGRGYGGELDDVTGRYPWTMDFYKFVRESAE